MSFYAHHHTSTVINGSNFKFSVYSKAAFYLTNTTVVAATQNAIVLLHTRDPIKNKYEHVFSVIECHRVLYYVKLRSQSVQIKRPMNNV